MVTHAQTAVSCQQPETAKDRHCGKYHKPSRCRDHRKMQQKRCFMAAHAGEKAWKTGTFKCQVCNEEVRVQKGRTIPKCPNGHTTFDERVDEPRSEKPLRNHPRKRTSSRHPSSKRGKTSRGSRSHRSSTRSGSSSRSSQKRSIRSSSRSRSSSRKRSFRSR